MRNTLLLFIIFIMAMGISAEIKGTTFSLASTTDSLMNFNENVIVSLPLNSLIFKRDNDSLFSSNISIQYTFIDKKDNPVNTSYIDTVINVSSYEKTKSSAIIDIIRDFPLNSNFGAISVRVYDLNSSNMSIFNSKLVLPHMADSSAYIKSIEEISYNAWHFENSNNMNFVVNYYVENPEYSFLNVIIKDNSRVYLTKKFELKESGTDTLNLKAELEVGKYSFTAEIIRDAVKIASASREFFIDFTFIYSDNAYNDIINALGFIAKSSEVKQLRNAKPEQRESKWNDFWKRAAEDPVLSGNITYYEFMSRYKYVNEQFSVHKKAGYKTDFGRIFIQYGQPDQIERFPFDTDTKPYEVWYYYSYGYEFIFMDVYGYGEYLLQNFYDQVR